jgi:CspA family cold shock protein
LYTNFKNKAFVKPINNSLIFVVLLTFIFIKVKKGTVKFFNESKGFGFVTEDDSNTEYFVHVSGLVDEIREGDAVEFDLKEGRKGLNAVDVRVL